MVYVPKETVEKIAAAIDEMHGATIRLLHAVKGIIGEGANT